MQFTAWRKWWYLLSLAVIVPGLISLALQGLNLGIDFTGGNLIQLQFEQQVSAGELREELDKFGLGNSVIQAAGDNQVLIRSNELTETQNQELLAAIEQRFGQLDVLRNEKVGAVIGRELTINAFYALLLAAGLIVIYITIRFEFMFGLAAIMALLHDVLITLGIFSLFRIQVDSAFVAAILTIIGYSINDTIVVFDRVRENLKLSKNPDLPQLVDRSIRQTLRRSIYTVLTTLFTLAALLVLGGETTKVFALALLIGITSGAYSSIFTASPLWLDLRIWTTRRRATARAGAR